MLLQETKVSSAKLEEILQFIKQKYEVVALYIRGSVRGITILWNPSNILAEGWIVLPQILS